ncbi:hypothetical protein ABG79_01411 [Caloramator mitchellensis]|uniref:Uncharacterized protein n=1 Tax=Caloramator mitchellensis TaxID=908809 RepID=A0A0R3JT58_CALMK|nr:hypothetical protein [Caloramator mitchellensis]KRQ86664.1 hypothetical protein ABG79_01411 [Caloramator mitchellensis]
MKNVLVIERVGEKDLAKSNNILHKLLLPFKENNFKLKNVEAALVKIPEGLERIKLSLIVNFNKRNNIVLSRDYDINFDIKFYSTYLIRALDIFTVKLKCDLRLNEILIADADNLIGKLCFYNLLPFARRIVLLTNNKNNLEKEAEFAYYKYGTSVAVVEDIVYTEKICDAMIITDEKYIGLLKSKKPALSLCRINEHYDYCFEDVDITLNYEEFFKPIFALGYLNVYDYEKNWQMAEKEGFRIVRFISNGNTVLTL